LIRLFCVGWLDICYQETVIPTRKKNSCESERILRIGRELKPILREHITVIKEGLIRNFIGIGHFMSLIGSSDLAPCRTAVWQLGSLIEDLGDFLERINELEKSI